MEIYYRFRGPNGSIDIASSPEEYSLLHCVSSHIELAHGLPICHNKNLISALLHVSSSHSSSAFLSVSLPNLSFLIQKPSKCILPEILAYVCNLTFCNLHHEHFLW